MMYSDLNLSCSRGRAECYSKCACFNYESNIFAWHNSQRLFGFLAQNKITPECKSLTTLKCSGELTQDGECFHNHTRANDSLCKLMCHYLLQKHSVQQITLGPVDLAKGSLEGNRRIFLSCFSWIRVGKVSL